jgi:predicted molibdopterin-dependent oxidoreductase YjgC
LSLALAGLLTRLRRRPADLATVAGRAYLNVAGAGFDSEVNRLANQRLRWARGRPRYVGAVLAELVSRLPGDRVRVESRRGAIVVAARVTGITPGTVFVPFHYAPRAANELTLTAWDPVSKQPLFKTAAVRVAREG